MRQRSKGFTVVELTIATAVFSVVLLVGLAAFWGIGKIFYKGITLTQTQETAQQLLTQLGSDLQLAPTVVPAQDSGSGDTKFLCLGNIRYTFNLYKEVKLSDHDNETKFGLLRDVLPGSGGCASPFGAASVALNQPAELLGNKMRLSKLAIAAAKDSGGAMVADLWGLNLTVAFGDDNYLQAGDTNSPVCNANLSSSEFCSVSSLSSTVNRGL